MLAKQSFIDDFDKMYFDNCDNKKMNTKMRGVSIGNSFHASNKRPVEYLIPDFILEKPGKISNLSQLRDSRPLAGRFSEIGSKIFEVGNKKAGLITTGPWHEILMLESEAQKAKFERSFPTYPHLKKYEVGENHQQLHKVHVPPAYLTQAGMKYNGEPFSPPNTMPYSKKLGTSTQGHFQESE